MTRLARAELLCDIQCLAHDLACHDVALHQTCLLLEAREALARALSVATEPSAAKPEAPALNETGGPA